MSSIKESEDFITYCKVKLILLRHTAVNRTDLSALGLVKVPLALNALYRVDYIDIALFNGVCRTFWQTYTACNTIFGNRKRQLYHRLPVIYCLFLLEM